MDRVSHAGRRAAVSAGCALVCLLAGTAAVSGETAKVAFGSRGVVVADDPLAAGAGLRILQGGGNAFDAAVAVAMAMNVVDPSNSHLGGHALIMLYDADRGEVKAINGTGPAPKRARLEDFPEGVPERGMKAVLVPGAVDACAVMLEEYGSMTAQQVLQPAIELAERLPVSPWFAEAAGRYRSFEQQFPRSVAAFLAGSGGAVPATGGWFRQPDLAATLRAIAAGGRSEFHRGRVAAAILEASGKGGGFMTAEDLRQYPARIVDPVAATYRGYTVYGQPLVSQGFLLLEALNIAEGFDLPRIGPGSAQGVHVLAEAMKLAFADLHAFAGDPAFVEVPLQRLLSAEYAARQRGRISMARAMSEVPAGRPKEPHGDTTTFVVADGAGNLVSVVQSLWYGFGAAVIPEGTGLFLNNRMTDFSLDPDSPNRLAGGKRPVFTLNSFILAKEGRPLLAGGTPGDYGQVQWNLQVLTRFIDEGMTAAEAVGAPRWRYYGPGLRAASARLALEAGIGEEVAGRLADRGHPVGDLGWGGNFSLVRLHEGGVIEGIGDGRSPRRAVAAW